MPSTKNDTPKIVNLSGALVVDRAQSLAGELAAAFAESSQVLVSLSLIEELDLSCLQVFYAASKQAKASGKDFHFIGTIPSRISKRLSMTGFLSRQAERAEDFEAALTDFS